MRDAAVHVERPGARLNQVNRGADVAKGAAGDRGVRGYGVRPDGGGLCAAADYLKVTYAVTPVKICGSYT